MTIWCICYRSSILYDIPIFLLSFDISVFFCLYRTFGCQNSHHRDIPVHPHQHLHHRPVYTNENTLLVCKKSNFKKCAQRALHFNANIFKRYISCWVTFFLVFQMGSVKNQIWPNFTCHIFWNFVKFAFWHGILIQMDVMFFNHRNLNKVLRDAGRPEILHTFDVWHMIKVIPKLITFVPSPVESQVFFNKDFEFF